MRRRTFVTAIAGGAAAGSTITAADATGRDARTGPVGDALLSPAAIDPDDRRLRIDIAPNGDGEWAITFGVDLDDDETAASFEEIEEDASPVREQFEEQLDAVLTTAQPTVDREIGVESLAVDTNHPQEGRGELVVRFRWHNFAWMDGDDLVVDDLLGTDLLAAADQLTIQWPEGYEVLIANPAPTEQSEPNRLLIWEDGSAAGEDGLALRFGMGADGLPLWFIGGTMGGVLALVTGVFYLFGRSSRTSRPEQRDRGKKPYETVGEEDS